MSGHNALVLAAGGSLRLGRAKQLLRRDGETLAHRAVRMALSTQPRRLLVVLGGHAEAVREALIDLPAQVVVNPHWQDGMAGSLQCALGLIDETDADAPTLILGCDQPALDAWHLRSLLDGAAAAASGCAATVHGDALGIPAVVSASLRRQAAQLRGDRGLGAPLTRLPAGTVWRLDAPELALDIDVEADVNEAVERGWLDR